MKFARFSKSLLAAGLMSVGISAFADSALQVGSGEGFDTGVSVSDKFTIEFWAKADTLADGCLNIVSDNGGNNEIDFRVAADGSARFVTWNEDKNDAKLAAGTVTAGTWNHYALVHEGNGVDMKIYLNGVMTSETGDAVPNFTKSPWGQIRIGQVANYNGAIDELRIWDDARTATEIADNYNATDTLTESTNLSAWYKFSEGNGSDFSDSSAAGNDIVSDSNRFVNETATSAGTDGYGLYLNSASNVSTGVTVPSVFTVAFWVKTPATLTNNCMTLRTDNGGNNKVNFWVNANGSAKFYTWGDATNTIDAPAGTFSADSWTHVALVHRGGGNGMDLVVNGVVAGTTATNFARNPWGILNFNNFGGTVDEFRVWNVAHDAATVSTQKDSLTPDSTGLIAHYKFNETSGTTASEEVAGTDITWTNAAYTWVTRDIQSGPTEITGYDAISDVDAGSTNAPTYADAAAVITYLNANLTSATITGSSPAATTAITGWADTDAYVTSTPRSYTFTGTLDTSNLPSGYVDAVDTITSVTVEVVVGNPAAALAIGDVIAVDISSVSGSAPKFNVIVPSENVSNNVYRGTVSSGSVVKYNDGTTVATGVSLALENSFDATGGNDGNSDWTGTAADPYYVDATEDIVYNNPTNPISLTFSGLDQSLKYNVRVYALYDDGGVGATDTYSVTNGAGTETSVMARADRMAATNLLDAGGVFNFLEADTNGEITASVQMTSGSGWTSFAAVVLEVVDPVTPAVGLEVSLEGAELTWTVEDEIDVKEYRVVNAETKEVIETVLAVGADFYSISVPEGVVLELVVVDNSGFSKSYAPADGNVKIEIYDLAEGWNLIAITSDDADLDTLRDETVGVIWGWNGAGYEVVETASATDAVWVYAPVAKQVYISGTKSNAEISLNVGWNMVGPVSETSIPVDADTIFSWGDKIYDTIADEQKVLIGGKGYWIFSL